METTHLESADVFKTANVNLEESYFKDNFLYTLKSCITVKDVLKEMVKEKTCEKYEKHIKLPETMLGGHDRLA